MTEDNLTFTPNSLDHEQHVSEGTVSLDALGAKAIKRAVLAESLTHPLTIFPGVLGVLGGVAWFLFGHLAMLLGGIGGVTVGLSSFVINFFFRDQVLAQKYLERVSEDIARRERQQLESLEKNLLACASIPGVSSHARQAANQFRKVQAKYEDLRRTMEEGLGTGDDLRGRVEATAEQVYLGVIDNLRKVEGLLRSVGTIDIQYIMDRLRQLSQLRRLTDADRREMEALRKRKAIRDEQVERVKSVLALNEEAITYLEEVAASLAARKGGDLLAQVNPDTAVGHLKELAEKIRGEIL